MYVNQDSNGPMVFKRPFFCSHSRKEDRSSLNPPGEPQFHFRVSTARSRKYLQKKSNRFSTGNFCEPVRLPFGRLTPIDVWYLPGITTQSGNQSQKKKWELLNCKPILLPTRLCFGRYILPDTVGQTGLIDSIEWLPLRKPARIGISGVPSRSR